MSARSLSAGRFTTGQLDVWMQPRVRRSHPLVVYAHGAGGNASEALGVGVPSVLPMLNTLVDAGHIIVAPTQTNLWGNVTSDDRMDAAIMWAHDNTSASDDPPVIIGASHGAACAVQYAVDNPVSCLVLLIPALDLEHARENDLLSLRDDIDAAWGVVYPAPLPVGGNPIDLDPGVPIQMWAASNDDFSTGAEAWTVEHGGTYHDLGTLGHTDAAVAAVDVYEIINFVSSQ